MSLIVGLTGGIASGKSTVSSMLMERGITVIDADIESRLAVEKGEKAYDDIVRYFGEDILNEDGTIDRAKLGSIIFNNDEKRLALNSFVHPEIRKRIEEKKEKAKRAGEKVIILDIPLLFEGTQRYGVNQTILVYVNPETQLERLMKRNHLTEDEARARINSQMPLNEKRRYADIIIDNNGAKEETEHQIEEIISNWNI